MNLKYLIIGAGGTGGCIGGYLKNADKDVTLIARGKHLARIKEKGLLIENSHSKDILLEDVKACTGDDYNDKADVIFICIKGYSIDSILSLIEKASHKETVIIPILNIYSTGEKLQKKFANLKVLDGCIYIASEILEPGVIKQKGDIFKVIFGRRDGVTDDKVLKQIETDLKDSGITSILSKNIKLDAYRKFSYVSAQGAVGLYYNIKSGEIQSNPKYRNDFVLCVNEIKKVGEAMGINLEEDITKTNLAILDNLDKDMTTSLQKDIAKGSNSEMDGLIFEVVRNGEKYNVEVPTYKKIADKYKKA